MLVTVTSVLTSPFPAPEYLRQTVLDGNSGSRFFVEVLGVVFLFYFVTSVSQLSTVVCIMLVMIKRY